MKKRSAFHYICTILSILLVTAVFLPFSAFAQGETAELSAVMVKNSRLAYYGTGFPVGVPGEPTDKIVTSYSVVATETGGVPATAKVRFSEFEGDIESEIIFSDAELNVAILQMPSNAQKLTALTLYESDRMDHGDKISTYGYSGTGNLTTDFESYGEAELLRLSGSLKAKDNDFGDTIYQYSEEFGRAYAGGPAFDDNNIVIGMCVHPNGLRRTSFKQYILPSESILKCMSAANIDYITCEEQSRMTIMIIAAAAGVVILAATLVLLIILLKKQPNNTENIESDKTVNYTYNLAICGGRFAGNIYEIGESMSVGRDDHECRVVYPYDEPGISSIHCTFIVKNGECQVIDRSSYGVFLSVNGMRLEKGVPYTLSDGEHIYLANKVNLMRIDRVSKEK